MFALPGYLVAHRLGERYTDACYRKENAVIEVETSLITYPEIPRYYPMSASFLEIVDEKTGSKKGILNTRYVNYFILENGAYWWPTEEGQTIRNRNITSEWNYEKKTPKNFIEMKDPIPDPDPTSLLPKEKPAFSEGIEDIRLFWNREMQEINWVGSTLNYASCNKIRMMMGKYDYVAGELTDAKIVESPMDTYCEKNWIPIYKHDPASLTLYFIYKWHPIEIGRIISNNSGLYEGTFGLAEGTFGLAENTTLSKLEIEIRHETAAFIFKRIRGSSCFLMDTIEGVEGWVGVVHYSEDQHPTRHYFHRLILLEKNSFKPLKYTDAFYFQKIGIEFCIGFTKEENRYRFWISRHDRDPMMLEIEKDLVPRWNTIGRWGV
jgi:hypothetical protein